MNVISFFFFFKSYWLLYTVDCAVNFLIIIIIKKKKTPLVMSKCVHEVGHLVLWKKGSESIPAVRPFLAPSVPAHLDPEQQQESGGSVGLVGHRAETEVRWGGISERTHTDWSTAGITCSFVEPSHAFHPRAFRCGVSLQKLLNRAAHNDRKT